MHQQLCFFANGVVVLAVVDSTLLLLFLFASSTSIGNRWTDAFAVT